MCHNVFIASRRPLPTNDGGTVLKFHLNQARDYEVDGLKDKFSLPNIYLVGSTTGCSCDLHVQDARDFEGIIEDRDPTRDRVACLQTFYNLLQEEARNGEIELYSCWAEDEHSPIETSIEFDTQTLSLDTFVHFPMQERRFIKLS
jgi:hypothetical protein